VYIPTPAIGSAAASKPTKRRRSVVAEQVFDRIAVAPDHRTNPEAANADRVAQLQSLAARNPDLFTAATGAAKIDSQKLSPSLQLTLINLLKYVVVAALCVRCVRAVCIPLIVGWCAKVVSRPFGCVTSNHLSARSESTFWLEVKR